MKAMSDELTRDYLDKKFEQFAARMVGLFEPRFKRVEERLEETATKDQLDRLMDTLDAFLKRLDDAEVNNLARDAQIARLERWIETIAQTGVKLEY